MSPNEAPPQNPKDALVKGQNEPRLFAEMPKLIGRVPYVALVCRPTPVAPCSTISDYLGRNDVWMKRDDQASPIFGGNKIRRFEHILADAQERGARTLVTVGGVASSQVTATLLVGRALGFEVTSVLFDQPITSFARRSILIQASAGGHLIHGGGYMNTALRTAFVLARTRRAYFIPPGASTPMANLGYVGAMFELADQVERGELPKPDIIVTAAGSGGTVAALSLGIMMLGWKTKVVGVRISERVACNRMTVRFLVEATAHFLRRRAGEITRRKLPDPNFEIDHAAAGRGYGYATKEAIEAVPEVTRLLGTPGEITYSGKALVGLRRVCAANPGKNILLWNTLSSRWPEPTVGREELPRSLSRLFDGDVPI